MFSVGFGNQYRFLIAFGKVVYEKTARRFNSFSENYLSKIEKG